MFETLYKTDTVTELERAEYYQPHLDVYISNGRAVYFVRERHGWYSDAEKRAIHNTTTLNPEEGFDTYAEAEAMYNKQIAHRASEGFVHSFSLDPFRGVIYRRVAV